MEHIFIINPAAGKGKAEKFFLPKIIKSCKAKDISYEIYKTQKNGDAEQFVKKRCEEGTNLRFYACGGDGTLNEVVNGAFGFDNAEIAMIPAGTGNDFPRNFINHKDFVNIDKQINGKPDLIDLIKYSYIEDEFETFEDKDKTNILQQNEFEKKSLTRFAVNMLNIGLDCEVVDKASLIKKRKFMPSAFAYIAGVAIVLGKKECVNLEIDCDDKIVNKGKIMLVAIGNGCFCGGGFKGVPRAKISDGVLDLSIVKNMSRRRFLALIGSYKNGKHLEKTDIGEILTYEQCKTVNIKTNDKIKLCVDGEIYKTGNLSFQVVPNAIKFSFPQSCE